MFTSGLYPGVVTHTRLKPRRHSLRYDIFMLLLDLDELDALDRSLQLFSLRRFNLVSFDPTRHGDGSKTPLRPRWRPNSPPPASPMADPCACWPCRASWAAGSTR